MVFSQRCREIMMQIGAVNVALVGEHLDHARAHLNNASEETARLSRELDDLEAEQEEASS